MLPASSRSLRASVLLVVLGAVALVAVACGGGDESPDEPATEAPATEAPATEVATAAPTEAPTEPPATEAPAADEGSVDVRYLRSLCLAGNDLQAAMFTAVIRMETEGTDPDDPEAFGELFVKPLAGFLEAIREITPPDDVAEYHAAALAQYEALVTLFASVEEGEELEGDPFELLGGMLSGAEEFPEIPQDALDRLAGVAEGVPECADSIILPAFLGQDDSGEVDTGDPADGGQGAEPDSEAEDYVRQLCLAGDDYDATIREAIAGMGPDADLDQSDPEVFATVFREALRALAEDLAGISPPPDIAEHHFAAAAQFGEIVVVLDGIMEALDAGREVPAEQLAHFRELVGGGIGMPGLPPSVANRFAQAANHVIECYNSGFLYGFLGGGG